jgi:type III pantothenate kinase
MTRKIALDIGNTRIKILTSANEHLTFSYREMNQVEITEILEPLLKGATVGVSSVNDNITSIVKSFGIKKLHFADELLSNQNAIDYSSIKGIGSDRLFGMVAARNLTKENCVTIDCGTANTINFLKGSGNVMGGYILPGLRTQLDAINHKTNKIFIEPEKLKSFQASNKIPDNTSDAVLKGIVEATSFGIISIIQNNFDLIDPKTIFITGGYRDLIFSNLKRLKSINSEDSIIELNNQKIEIIIKPYLVLEGILSVI